MRNILKVLIIIFAFTSCTSYTCPTYAQKNDSGKNYKNIEFKYFRVVAQGKKKVQIDIDGVIFINRKYIVIKANEFGQLDDRYDLNSRVKIKGRKAWNAHPYGKPEERVYIEYKKDEYITILFVKKYFVIYFINSKLKSKLEPLPKPGIPYEKFN